MDSSHSAPALKCGARDRWIDRGVQFGRLHLVTNNSRFLILPGAERNLGSRVLSLCTRRLVRGLASPLRSRRTVRFHPRCYYRRDDSSPTETRPAMIAVVTSLSGAITGTHRTWLAPDGLGKAPVDTPRRAMGNLLGHAVRFGATGDAQ